MSISFRILLPLFFAGSLWLVSCESNQGNTIENDTNNVETTQLVAKPRLVEASMGNGKYTMLVPEGFTISVDTTLTNKRGEPLINTFKLISILDSVSAVGISHGLKDRTKPFTLDVFMQRLEKEARGYQHLRSLESYTQEVDGRKFGVMEYSLQIDNIESDFAAVCATVVGTNMLTMNILFKGPRMPYHSEMTKQILESLRINE